MSMKDIKNLFKQYFLQYASYVILDRAIPDIVDGLKPVQRRILYTLHKIDDGKLHKVANVSGQTMALHPHGDAPINEALVNLANKGYLLDRQGNFGNPFTGDPAAAARYIETRLSELSRETLFNSALTTFSPSYDGRGKEPVTLPAKIPLLLLQGAEGIAVGMSTQILPHNFVELLQAEIAVLEDREFTLYPDFPTGGAMDPSEYQKGLGKVRLRARINAKDQRTLVIDQICYGTTTESLTRSIEEAAKKGKIKIDSIHDYTSDKVEIEIKLARGHNATQVIDALYAFTDCEISVNSQIVVIKDNYPCEMNVDEVIRYHAHRLMDYLQQELEIEKSILEEKVFIKTLEQIFIENKLYKALETISSADLIHSTIASAFIPYHEKLLRIPTVEDREKLLNIPIRRISQFDLEKNQKDRIGLEKQIASVQKSLKNVRGFTIRYIQSLLDKYGHLYPRKTEITNFSQVDLRRVDIRKVKIGIDRSKGFIGTKVESSEFLECSPLDKILIIFNDGTYIVKNQPEKEYYPQDQRKFEMVRIADKTSVLSAIYRNLETGYPYIKRFIVKQFILDKEYRYLGEDEALELLLDKPQGFITFYYEHTARTKVSQQTIAIESYASKGVSAGGIRIAPRKVIKVKEGKADQEISEPSLPL